MELKRAAEGEKGFQKVFAFLHDQLIAGSLKPGNRLVSERELATQLGVSRPLVREALRGRAAWHADERIARFAAPLRQRARRRAAEAKLREGCLPF
jgi:DNA-binding transcriptional MocR family regulator